MLSTPPFRGGRDQGWVGAVVEIPRGSRNKYEFDHEGGFFRLDRVLYSSVHYPTDYGFIPQTLSGDGDPLDVLVIVEEPTFTGCYLRARPIGTLTTTDEKGPDEKILAVPQDDRRYDSIIDLPNLPDHWLKEIANFFRTYKELQGVQTEVRDWFPRGEAWRIIEEARARYHEQEHGAEP